MEHARDCDGDCDSIEQEPDCVDGLIHRWTSEGEGGCDQNPGVWSTGGTTLKYRAHCRWCGCGRREVEHGSQRNPFECDTTEYIADAAPVDAAELRAEIRRTDRNRRARDRRALAICVAAGLDYVNWDTVHAARRQRRAAHLARNVGRAHA